MKTNNLISQKWTYLRKFSHGLLSMALLFLLTTSCKKSETLVVETDNSTLLSVKEKLKNAGFDLSEGFSKSGNGYLVEYDIFLSMEDINNLSGNSKVKVENELTGPLLKTSSLKSTSNSAVRKGVNNPVSHYTTNQLLNWYWGSPRNITVYIDSYFGPYMQNALDIALARYNQLDFGLHFTRVYSAGEANIQVIPVSGENYLMSAGFPDNAGNPYNRVRVNTAYYNNSTTRNDAASCLAHEIGHTIGFRHTDFMNRAFSCGGSNENEGYGSSGAVYVPGTDATPAPGSKSWMLACSDNIDRPFTLQDIVALKGTYSYRKNIYVKEVMNFITSDSWYDSVSDWDMVEYGIVAEFYQDADRTIPYAASNYFILNTFVGPEDQNTSAKYLIPEGATSYDLGVFHRERHYQYGNLVQDNTTGFRVAPFNGYYGPYFPN
jgi:hypothetical protein